MRTISEELKSCRLCGRACGVDRTRRAGRCGETVEVYAARAALHMWEEPCISGKEGSGAVFFTGCPLGCIFCQNREIALGSIRKGPAPAENTANARRGVHLTIPELAAVFLRLQAQGANNINLVTPTHFVPQIRQAVSLARQGTEAIQAQEAAAVDGKKRPAENPGGRTLEKENPGGKDPDTEKTDGRDLNTEKNPETEKTGGKDSYTKKIDAGDLNTEKNPEAERTGGEASFSRMEDGTYSRDFGQVNYVKKLTLPIVYNTASYETAETIRSLAGTVDIFLPDLKFFDPEISGRYAAAPDYFTVAAAAIREMVAISGAPAFDERGMMKRGTIVRHMVLPGHTRDSMKILDYLAETFGDEIYISIMNQYTPMPGIGEKDPLLARQVTRREYDRVLDHALSLGLTKVYIQEGGTAAESFIPAFDGEGLKNTPIP